MLSETPGRKLVKSEQFWDGFVRALTRQEALGEMIRRSWLRVSFFMNRFRKLGFLAYSGSGLQVHSSLLERLASGVATSQKAHTN